MKQKKKTKIDYEFVFDNVIDLKDDIITITISWILFIAFVLFLLATVFCLLISVVSSIYFLTNIIGFIIGLNDISYIWSGSDYSMSPIPTYLGLVAIAGAIMAYVGMKWLTTYSRKSKEEWEEYEQLFKWYLQLSNSLYL